MAWKMLPTNYKDAIWAGLKKFNQIFNPDGTLSFQDVTVYTSKEDSFFGAQDANRMNEALNTIMSMVENGTDLYEAFQAYFETQQILFTDKSEKQFKEFKDFLYSMETEGEESLTQIADRAATSERNAKASETAAKTSETNAKTSETNAKASEEAAKTAKSGAVTAQQAAETAQSGAEYAQSSAASSAQSATQAAEKAEAVSTRVPYVGENGHWFVWDNDVDNYVDTEIPAQGETGPQGPQGIQGPAGPRGIDGVAVVADGYFAFNVNEQGHLILSYTGSEAPDVSIDENGHLIMKI